MEIMLQFLALITISIFWHLSFAQPGFLSLDCGGSTNYTDSAGIHWIPDDSFVNGGTKVALQAVPDGRDESLQFRTFPERLKNCYAFRSLDNTTKYLIRATFHYTNYGNPPVFHLILDANIWDTISFQNTTKKLIVKEIVVMPKSSGTIYVCLGRGQTGVPFISSLELRKLSPNMYGLVNQSYSLLKLKRTTFGSSNKNTRYPDDPYDRIWETSAIGSWNISTLSNVSQGTVPDQPPSSVMRTAKTNKRSSTQGPSPMDLSPRLLRPNGYLYFSMYFAELEKLNASFIREFDVYVDNKLLYDGLQPKYLEATNVSVMRWCSISITSRIPLMLKPTNRSVLSPLVNALEIYGRMLVEETLAQDVEGIREIQKQFKLENFGDGDPCLPASYSWEWLACSSDISPRITSLNLSSKGLIGTIPLCITFLSALVYIDLSNNYMSGPVPDFLSKLENLKELNLENNNFNGVLPDSLKFVSVRTAGNPLLCQSGKICSRSGGNGSEVFIIVLVLGFLCFAAVVIKSFVGSLESPIKIDTSKCREFTYNEIIQITGGFQKQIGHGGFGRVYYGRLENGTEVAIKMLSEKSMQGAIQFSTEVAMLSRVHHKNVVSLLGYCCQKQNQILVYKYMPKGNLKQLLHDEEDLSWESRLDIALNAAQGLEYLHSGCEPPIIHRDVKTANILLNAHMEAKIADFGLSRVGPSHEITSVKITNCGLSRDIGPSSEVTHVSTDVKGTFGYLDPEYYTTGNLTEKSDVYSFGVVLLELISGRPSVFNIDESGESIHIVSWAELFINQGNIKGILDTKAEMKIMKNTKWRELAILYAKRRANETAMLRVAKLAMRCTKRWPNERPSMNEVVIKLKQCIQMLH